MYFSCTVMRVMKQRDKQTDRQAAFFGTWFWIFSKCFQDLSNCETTASSKGWSFVSWDCYGHYWCSPRFSFGHWWLCEKVCSGQSLFMGGGDEETWQLHAVYACMQLSHRCFSIVCQILLGLYQCLQNFSIYLICLEPSFLTCSDWSTRIWSNSLPAHHVSLFQLFTFLPRFHLLAAPLIDHLLR